MQRKIICEDFEKYVFFEDLKSGNILAITKQELEKINAIREEYNYKDFKIPDNFKTKGYILEIINKDQIKSKIVYKILNKISIEISINQIRSIVINS